MEKQFGKLLIAPTLIGVALVFHTCRGVAVLTMHAS